MATETVEKKGCTFQWQIQNVSLWWWLEEAERIESPTFIVDGMECTKWSLWLYPIGDAYGNSIGFFLHRKEDCDGPDEIQVNYQLAILSKDGSIFRKIDRSKSFKKNSTRGSRNFTSLKTVFVTEKEVIIHEDSLTVQCTISKEQCVSNHVFATTVINVKRNSFVWRINKISTLKSEIRNKFKDYFICFDAILNEDFDKLRVDLSSFDDDVKYISCSVSIIDLEGRKENCEIKKYFSDDLKEGLSSSTLHLSKSLMENKIKYFPNDVLSLEFDIVIATVEHFDCKNIYSKLENDVAKREKCDNLKDDLKSMYNDGIFNDIELCTSTKTFPAHKGLLSSRSPVFKSMFSNDMKEKSSGQVSITDFEDDIIHRMLLYLYTDSLEDLQFETASKLYKIADKYQILSLKNKCSYFLEENLTQTNAFEVLALADLHHDNHLKSDALAYILRQSNQIFCSQEWDDFMKSHLELAAEIMHSKLTKHKMHLS